MGAVAAEGAVPSPSQDCLPGPGPGLHMGELGAVSDQRTTEGWGRGGELGLFLPRHLIKS